MKIFNIILKAILGIVFVSLCSCTDDFVDRENPYVIDSESYFNSEDEYNQALIGVYESLHGTSLAILISEIASDNAVCGGGSTSDQPALQQIDNMTHTPVSNRLKEQWDWLFAGVNRANFIIEFQDKTDFEGKEVIIGETRFLRAYFYFHLVNLFGEVPLKQTRFVTGDETRIPRSSIEQVYKFIEDDLIYAVNNLDYDSVNGGRATKGAAQALLGKAYLYQDKFSDAANVLTDLINNGPYDLVSNFGEIFEYPGENNIESVFEIQYIGNEGINPGTDSWNVSEGNIFVGFNGVREYSGPLYENGYGFTVFTQDLVDIYDDNDSRKNATILDMNAWSAAIENFQTGDLSDEVLVDDIIAWKAANPNAGVTFSPSHEGIDYYNKKYIPRVSDNQSTTQFTEPNNYRAIRFADVLLMAAEALNRGQINDVLALTYLNRVRQRAFNNPSFNRNEQGESLTEAIYEERRLEFAGEGHRFFDLVRTGRGSQILGFQPNKNEVFPIPREEVIFSEGNWDQNEGYN